MTHFRWSVVAGVGLLLAACAGDPYSGPKQNTGALTGSIAGGAIGAAVTGGGVGSRLAGGVAGALIGGLVGSTIGAALDDEDRERAYAAQMQALDQGAPGAPVTWRNPDSGRYGNIVPGPTYQRAGAPCRQFTHTVYIDGRPQTARGTACRTPDGTWQAIS